MTDTKQVNALKGGTFAINDIPLIRKALLSYLASLDSDDAEVSRIGLLLHRLNRISK